MHRLFALLQFLDQCPYPLVCKRIKSVQEIAIVQNFLLEMVALIAHGAHPLLFRREQKTLSVIDGAAVGATMA